MHMRSWGLYMWYWLHILCSLDWLHFGPILWIDTVAFCCCRICAKYGRSIRRSCTPNSSAFLSDFRYVHVSVVSVCACACVFVCVCVRACIDTFYHFWPCLACAFVYCAFYNGHVCDGDGQLLRSNQWSRVTSVCSNFVVLFFMFLIFIYYTRADCIFVEISRPAASDYSIFVRRYVFAAVFLFNYLNSIMSFRTQAHLLLQHNVT